MMDSTNLIDYCDYNARKAWYKRMGATPLPRIERRSVASRSHRAAIIVQEHDASPTIRERIRNAFGGGL